MDEAEVTINVVEAMDMFWVIGERINQLARVRRDCGYSGPPRSDTNGVNA